MESCFSVVVVVRCYLFVPELFLAQMPKIDLEDFLFGCMCMGVSVVW